MHEAKTHLSELVEHALHGDEVVITRRGKPAVLTRAGCASEGRARTDGSLEGAG